MTWKIKKLPGDLGVAKASMRHIPLSLRDLREAVDFLSMLLGLRKLEGPVAVQSMG